MLLSGLLFVLGAAILAANVVLLNTPGNAAAVFQPLSRGLATYEYASFLSIWLSSFLCIFAMRAPATSYSSRCAKTVSVLYQLACLLVAALLFVGHNLSRAYGTPALASALVVAVGINLVRAIYATVELPERSVGTCCKKVIAVAFDVVVLVLFALLLGGCYTQSVGYRFTYPPRGEFATFRYRDKTVQRVHYWCTGERNTSLPTFWLEVGGGGHSMSDLYGLQFALNAKGRRVCQYDVPGTGWSDPAYPAQDPVSVMEGVMGAAGEIGPFVMVGTMDDAAERIYEFALRNPTKVVALIPVDYAGGPSEWEPLQRANNWTHAQIAGHARDVLTGRLRMGNFIRAIGVQWGIMRFFLSPSGDYEPASMEPEKNFLNLFNEKQWTRQTMVLKDQVDDIESVFLDDVWTARPSLSANITVFPFLSTSDAVAACKAQGLPVDSVGCRVLIEGEAYRERFASLMASRGSGKGRVFKCAECVSFTLTGAHHMEWFVQSALSVVESK